MEITVLGSGSALPYARRNAPGFAIRAGTVFALLDAGSGVLRRTAEAGIELQRVPHLFLSHFHLDHTADLMPILFAKRQGLPRNGPLTVHGPPGLRALRDGLGVAYGKYVEPKGYELEWDEVDPTGARPALDTDDLTVTAHAVDHEGQPAVAYRLSAGDGKTIAYSGDSGPCEGLVEAGRLADLFVIDCAAPDAHPRKGHLTPGDAGRIGREARARRLLLTHLSPEMDALDVVGAASRHFPGDVVVAEDLMRIKL
ncbi:MAG TPA: MBL fold metallo-hydrolase [Planctomycetota bacterium]|nr:MBL fold metallo-hydrolase [Planctomycetota bacterium]